MEQSGQSVAGSEDSFSQAPEEYMKGSIALGFRAGREPLQGSPGKDSIHEDSEEDRRSNYSMDSQHMIRALTAKLELETAKANAAVYDADATKTKLILVLAFVFRHLRFSRSF
jgi:hypothetical protein